MVSGNPQKTPSNIAYLVIRDGKKWSDVFRLTPGRTVTIGRSPNSQIVIKDEQASRQHAEIFLSDGRWTLRDLGSRNGTAVGAERVYGDHRLKPGDVIWIASTQMAFVNDLSSAYNRKVFSKVEIGGETVNGLEVADEATVALTPPKISEPTHIVQRAQRPKFLKDEGEHDSIEESKVSVDATRLCRLAFELANETTPRAIARMAIDCLIEGTHVDAGAVLMVPVNRPTTTDPELLEILAWRSENQPEYQRVSKFLAETVLNSGEAVLARDVEDDSALGLRDESGRIHATGVIAAPIRMNHRVVGLVHLYSTRKTDLLDADDLEFTLAVAETVAMALRTRYREQKLVEDLTKTRSEIDQLRSQLGVESEIIGASPAMLRVHQEISRAAPSNATVLIRGESGVGKELVARSVHFTSPRKVGPFVCLNCAALTESLLESELFGHEKGAFTGATDRKVGKFEAAHKGTLMLDEIGEMSMSIQAKFLRVLEGHPFERVGGSKAIKTDVRVIAATNRDLEEAVRKGAFRKDLFFRLHVIQIEVPALRYRPEDILLLAEYFLNKFNAETGRRMTGFTPQARSQLQRYRWPGNVREMKNVIERAVVLARGNEIQLDDLLLTNLATATESRFDFGTLIPEYVPASLEEVERKHIEATLISTDWNKSKTAQILGIERSTLDRKIKRYDIEKD
jgi:transcriptional regulator with GAF, ATPase, and Fis domain